MLLTNDSPIRIANAKSSDVVTQVVLSVYFNVDVDRKMHLVHYQRDELLFLHAVTVTHTLCF